MQGTDASPGTAWNWLDFLLSALASRGRWADLELSSCHHRGLDCPMPSCFHLPKSQHQLSHKSAEHFWADPALRSCHHHGLDGPMSRLFHLPKSRQKPCLCYKSAERSWAAPRCGSPHVTTLWSPTQHKAEACLVAAIFGCAIAACLRGKARQGEENWMDLKDVRQTQQASRNPFSKTVVPLFSSPQWCQIPGPIRFHAVHLATRLQGWWNCQPPDRSWGSTWHSCKGVSVAKQIGGRNSGLRFPQFHASLQKGKHLCRPMVSMVVSLHRIGWSPQLGFKINGACSITSLRAFHVQHVATCLVAMDNKAARILCTQGIRPAALSQSRDGCSHPRGPRDLKCLDKGVEWPRHFDSRSGTEISGTIAAWSRWILVLPKCETVLWKGHSLMFFFFKESMIRMIQNHCSFIIIIIIFIIIIIIAVIIAVIIIKNDSDRRKFRRQTSDNMDRWKAEQGRGREKRKIRRKKSRRERVRREKDQKKEE